MTGSMSANTLAAHWADGFLQVAEGAARFGTQYWIGDCTDDVWREAAAAYPSSIRIVKPWRDRQRTLNSLKLAEDTGAFAVGMDFESGFYNPECEPQRADALEGYVKATGLPFVFKAVGSAESARIARDAGAAAIIVTTHGGAHGPSWAHPMEILPEVVTPWETTCWCWPKVASGAGTTFEAPGPRREGRYLRTCARARPVRGRARRRRRDAGAHAVRARKIHGPRGL